ncbi:MAG: sulfite exporter TauE/SafE family protein, partial [Bacteroidales bacterium]|nr:sulfite exporter TauE/SafE family protein [Bacteroidales bacterium]
QGTSLLVLLLPVGIFAVMHYAKINYIDYKYAAVLIFATVLGSYVGSVVSTHIPAKTLKTIFGIFLLLVSLKMIFNK